METPAPSRPELPLHEWLREHARRTPDKAACLWYGGALSFAELDRLSDAFGARLQALGVGKGDAVALFLGNCPQYLIAQYGIQKVGAIASPVSPLNKAHELAYQLEDLGARVIVASDALLPLVREVRGSTSIAQVFVTGYAELLPAEPALALPDELRALQGQERHVPDDALDLLQAARADARPQPVAIDLDDVALMVYTSGSTGRPKGAMLSYRNAWFKTAAVADCNGLSGDDVLLSIAPLYHIAGMVMGVNTPVLAGTTAVLLYRFDPLAVVQAIERHRVSWWYSVAPMNVAVMALPEAKTHDLSSLRINPVTSFGIDWTEKLASEWRGVAKNCASMEAAYGLSETHTVDTYMPRDAVRWGTHGLPVPGNEIRILDPDTGRERPRGETGEIVLRSPGVFKGYWKRPDATEQTLRDGWVYTGDMGRIDAEGYLTFLGRFKEMIKVSGYSVFPEEVEAILNKHPAVRQSAVIGIADPTKGEVVKAFVVLHEGQALDAEALVAWSRENMATYKAPREVRFVDALPATGAGKVLRRLLKDLP